LKIAYLIAAHNNYQHLKRLIYALNDSDCRFYIHIDKKSTLPYHIKAENIIFLDERINVHWSGFSQVRATIHLLERAFEDDNDYYAYLSGTDYPIKSNSFLYNKLKEGGEYMDIRKMGTDPYAPLSRYKYYYFTDLYDRRNKQSRKTRFFIWFQKELRKLRLRKNIPFQLYTGASWFILSKKCVDHVLKQIRENKRYIAFFKSGFCADESFFQTIVGNSDFYKNVKGYLTYADWSADPGPAIITEQHLPILKDETNKFFARKFSDDSVALINRIDREIRSVTEQVGIDIRISR